MKLSEFSIPTLQWNEHTWYAGHFYSPRSPSAPGPFNPKRHRRAHTGHDEAAPWGTPIVAPQAGKVHFAGWQNSGIGHAVIIDHGEVEIDIDAVGAAALGDTVRVFTRHGHMAPNKWWQKETFQVVTGQLIPKGQVLGFVGNSGASAGPHNHTSVTIEAPEHVSWRKRKHLDAELIYTGTSPYYYYDSANGGLTMEAVKGLQRIAAANGFDPGPIDGKWGSKTEQAWNEMQAAALAGGGNIQVEMVEVVRNIANLGG